MAEHRLKNTALTAKLSDLEILFWYEKLSKSAGKKLHGHTDGNGFVEHAAKLLVELNGFAESRGITVLFKLKENNCEEFGIKTQE